MDPRGLGWVFMIFILQLDTNSVSPAQVRILKLSVNFEETGDFSDHAPSVEYLGSTPDQRTRPHMP